MLWPSSRPAGLPDPGHNADLAPATPWIVDPAASEYSTMTVLPSGRIGVFYETAVWSAQRKRNTH